MKKKKTSAAQKGYTAVGLSEEEMTKAKRSGIMRSDFFADKPKTPVKAAKKVR